MNAQSCPAGNPKYMHVVYVSESKESARGGRICPSDSIVHI